MPKEMEIYEIGNSYELKRDQWQGKTALISKDSALLEKVKMYTWTYYNNEHPYLRNSANNISLHKFVMCHIYGEENIEKLLAEDNIIEHLDNNGLNCTYENLHILSSDLNKAKAFTIDKLQDESEHIEEIPPFITDVYYMHTNKCFQMQIFFNDNVFCNTKTGNSLMMIICQYNNVEDLLIDWWYVLKNRQNKSFDIKKLIADKITFEECPNLIIEPNEINKPLIIRDGVVYMNLDAKNDDGTNMIFMNHTALRGTIEEK